MSMTNLPTQMETPTPQMKRDDYKAIKHMDKATLTAYLKRIYTRGYEDGLKAATSAVPPKKAIDE